MAIKIKSKIGKAVIDIVLILMLVGCFISTSVFEKSKEALHQGAKVVDVFHWGTSHCIVSLVLVIFICFHIWQHWAFTKSIFQKKLYSKNILVILSFVMFILTVLTISLYLFGFTFSNLHFHSLVTHLFIIIVIIHLLTKWKQLCSLLKNNKNLTGRQLQNN